MTKFNLRKEREKLFEIILHQRPTAGRIYRIIKKQDKEFIKLLKEEDETYEAKVVGLVWGLYFEEPFDSQYFNNKFNELRLQHYRNKVKLAGSELTEELK